MQNPVFGLWVAAGGSVTPPMHSNVFVGVFGMRSEFIHAPLMPSALEIKEYLEFWGVAHTFEVHTPLHGAS